MPATPATFLEQQGPQKGLVIMEPFQQPPTDQESAPRPPSDQERQEVPLTVDEIATEAFALYAAGGYQDGHDVDHWLEAERLLKSRRAVTAS